MIALGANLSTEAGRPEQSLIAALKMFPEAGLRLRALSRFWRSSAFPAGSGPDYVNACAVISAALTPDSVLQALHRIEARLGRLRMTRWGPRGIDLDLLAAGDTIRPDAATEAAWRHLPLADQLQRVPDTLILPHPRLAERAFVLIPLAEIAPSWRHPATGRTVSEMLESLDPTQKAGMVPFSAPFEGQGGL